MLPRLIVIKQLTLPHREHITKHNLMAHTIYNFHFIFPFR